ncbi:MAG: RNA-binding protein [Caldiserica bacterium]|nr:MAG: RNA-binding protein [Caldisericota bacterium]
MAKALETFQKINIVYKHMSKEEFTGRVIKIMSYGAFIKLDDGNVGLIHVSQFSNMYVKDARDYVKEGERVVVKTVGKTKKNGKLNLTLVKKIGEIEEKPKIKNGLDEKIKKFLRESEKSNSANNRRIERKIH